MEQDKTRPVIRLNKIVIVHETDINPDMSVLGRYSEEPGPDDRTIDREAIGHMGPHEFRYFVAAMSGKETGNPDSVEQDYRRVEALNNGEWYSMGIWAQAEVSYADGTRGIRCIERLRSGGLWGIASDDDSGTITEAENEQLDELYSHLEVFGIDLSNWEDKVASAEHKMK